MSSKYIPKEELVVRGIYKLRARNLYYGVWTGTNWIGIRDKFGYHLDSCEVPYHTAYPIEFDHMLPEHIDCKERLPTECHTCGGLVEYHTNPPELNPPRGYWDHIGNVYDDHKLSPIGRQYKPLFDYLMNFEDLK